MRIKKLVVFMLVFTAVCGFAAVDSACADLVDKEGMITPEVRRIDKENISVSMFGQTAVINQKELAEEWADFSGHVRNGLDNGVNGIREFFSGDEEERNYDSIKVRML